MMPLTNGVDSSRIRRIEVLPGSSLSASHIDLDHSRRNLAVAKDKQTASICRPGSGHLVALHAGDQSRLAAVDRICVDVAVRANVGDQIAAGGENKRRAHAFGADGVGGTLSRTLSVLRR